MDDILNVAGEDYDDDGFENDNDINVPSTPVKGEPNKGRNLGRKLTAQEILSSASKDVNAEDATALRKASTMVRSETAADSAGLDNLLNDAAIENANVFDDDDSDDNDNEDNVTFDNSINVKNLFFAVYHGNIRDVEKSLDNGALATIRDRHGW